MSQSQLDIIENKIKNIIQTVRYLKIIYKVYDIYNNINTLRIQMQQKQPQKKQKERNGYIEQQRLSELVRCLNEGLLPKLYEKIEGVLEDKIKYFETKGGRKKHYDMSAYTQNDIPKIEVKSYSCLPKDTNQRPWEGYPQLVNAPYTFLTVCTQPYIDHWYDTILPHLKELYPTLPQLPNKNDWVKQDLSQGSVESEFGKQLKVIKQTDEKKWKELFQTWRYQCNQAVKKSITHQNTEMEYIIENEMNNKLKEKTLWINTSYTSSDTISPLHQFQSIVTRTPSVLNLKIMDITCKTDFIIHTQYKLSNSDDLFKGEARLRWGNGNGIANLRWNIK